ncbi:Protein of unknown function [Gryllus bimaculatus]|nr:Protein of unknown function [Gryllus bimaculatus]
MLPPCEEPRRPASCPSGPPPPAPPPPPPPQSPSPPPTPGPDGDAPEDTSPPLTCYAPKKGTGNDLQKSSEEFKLQELVQQRDCLLNTGTYALDHHLISLLNKQIRQLLAESTHTFE